MATAMPKTADKKAAGARARASIVDATRDGVTVRVDVTQGENVERSQLDRDALGRWAS